MQEKQHPIEIRTNGGREKVHSSLEKVFKKRTVLNANAIIHGEHKHHTKFRCDIIFENVHLEKETKTENIECLSK